MKERAEKALAELYDKYKSEGIVSMYLWGSILTDDFNKDSSDIDSIAIVEDSFPPEKEKEMMDFIRQDSEMKEFFVRILYRSELNGEKAKAPLASVIDPRLLLLEMTNWQYVIGKEVTNQDFILKAPSYREGVGIHMRQIQAKGWGDAKLVPENDHVYFIKTICRVVDLLQKERGGDGLFSYSKLLKESKNGSDVEKKVISAMFESRKGNWNYEIFLGNSEVFQEFLDSMKS